MFMKKVNISVLEFGFDYLIHLLEIENSIEAFQNHIEGYVEPIYFGIEGKRFVLICDEEGKLKDKKMSLIIKRSLESSAIVGKCFICKVKNHSFQSLTDDDLNLLFKHLFQSDSFGVHVLELS